MQGTHVGVWYRRRVIVLSAATKQNSRMEITQCFYVFLFFFKFFSVRISTNFDGEPIALKLVPVRVRPTKEIRRKTRFAAERFPVTIYSLPPRRCENSKNWFSNNSERVLTALSGPREPDGILTHSAAAVRRAHILPSHKTRVII